MNYALLSLVPKPVFAALVALLLVGAGVQTIRLHFAERAIAKQEEALVQGKRDLSQCRENVATLDQALALQNDAVRNLAREGDRLAGEASRALSDAQRANRDTASRIQAIENAQAGTDHCASADALIRSTVR